MLASIRRLLRNSANIEPVSGKGCAQLRGEELGAIALVALGIGREADTRDGVFG